jgi:hypothetical protein
MFDESQVRGILQRAIELDAAKGGKLTRDELVQAAAEVGVSREALEQAMAEQANQQSLTQTTPAKPIALSVPRLVNLGAAVGLAGAFFPTSFSGPLIVPSLAGALCFGSLIMFSGALALSDSMKSLRRYLAENTGVWVGFGFGGVLAGELISKFGSVSANAHWVINTALAYSAVGVVVTTVAGSTLLVIRRASGRSTAESDSATTGGPGSPPRLLYRATSAVRRWLTKVWKDHLTNRSDTSLPVAGNPDEVSAF